MPHQVLEHWGSQALQSRRTSLQCPSRPLDTGRRARSQLPSFPRATLQCAAAKGFGVQSAPKQEAGAASRNRPSLRRDSDTCPCGSGRLYEDCCQMYHRGEAAPTPEALMRARFSAFVKQNADFLVATTHPENPLAGGSKTADGRHSSTLEEDLHATFRKVEWAGLKLMGSGPGKSDDEAHVSFRASFRVVDQLQHGQKQKGIPLQRLTERARFLRQEGVWLYVDGDVNYSAEPS